MKDVDLATTLDQLDMPLIHLTVVEPTYYQSLQRMPA